MREGGGGGDGRRGGGVEGGRAVGGDFFKQKTAYEIHERLVGSEMCIRDSFH